MSKNVYQKLAEARKLLQSEAIPKSGHNKFAGYKYHELADFQNYITVIEDKVGLLSVVEFGETESTLTLYNAEKPDECIVFKSPVKDVALKGCQQIQNLAAQQTFLRRYLLLVTYSITDADAIEPQTASDEKKSDKKAEKVATDYKKVDTSAYEKTDVALKRLFAVEKELGVKHEQVKAYIKATFDKDSTKELTIAEINSVILKMKEKK